MFWGLGHKKYFLRVHGWVDTVKQKSVLFPMYIHTLKWIFFNWEFFLLKRKMETHSEDL